MQTQLTPPCTQCPIHRRGYDKSGPVCMSCEARCAYVVAMATGDAAAVIPSWPKEAEKATDPGLPRPPARPNRSRNYRRRKTGPYTKRVPDAAGGRRLTITRRRMALKLTQEALAGMVGSTQRTISYLEQGHTCRPRRHVALALERVLGLPISQLLRLEPAPPQRAAR